MKDLILTVLGIIATVPVLIIGLCVFIGVLSMSVEAITGYDLIHETIRPAFRRTP